MFKVEYFKNTVFLSQSPQLAKQMCIAGDMERVYEVAPGESRKSQKLRKSQRNASIAKKRVNRADFSCGGSVFRAEDSNTARHLTEFMGLDLEMAIEEHYHEVVDVLDSVFLAIFKGLKENYSNEVETIRKQFPCDEFTYLDETLKLRFAEGIQMLREAGAKNLDGTELSDTDDLR